MRPDLQMSQQLTPSTLRFRLALLLLFILHPSAFILGQAPVLRIETGMHTAIIRRIATDAQGRWLVTASDDKTARVWELPSGRLLRVLRPPIGDGDEGKLNAIALSPDGNTVATGGSTGAEWDKQVSIYLFDRASGQLRQRLTGLPQVVQHLTYSRDGRWLAATLGAGGLRVYAAADYTLTYSAHSTATKATARTSTPLDAWPRVATTASCGSTGVTRQAVGNASPNKPRRTANGPTRSASRRTGRGWRWATPVLRKSRWFGART